MRSKQERKYWEERTFHDGPELAGTGNRHLRELDRELPLRFEIYLSVHPPCASGLRMHSTCTLAVFTSPCLIIGESTISED